MNLASIFVGFLYLVRLVLPSLDIKHLYKLNTPFINSPNICDVIILIIPYKSIKKTMAFWRVF